MISHLSFMQQHICLFVAISMHSIIIFEEGAS